MLVQLMSILDILVVISIFISSFDYGKSIASIILLIYLIKSAIFLPNIASIIDMIVGIVFVFALFGFFNIITWIAFIWLIQKAVFSLIT